MLLTDLPEVELAQCERLMAAGDLNPRDVKLRLARELVSSMHSADAAREAETEFLRVFSQRETPSEMPTFVIRQPMINAEVLVAAGLARSKNKARRLVAQGRVRLDGQWVSDIGAPVTLSASRTPPAADRIMPRVGRRRFLRLVNTRREREDN